MSTVDQVIRALLRLDESYLRKWRAASDSSLHWFPGARTDLYAASPYSACEVFSIFMAYRNAASFLLTDARICPKCAELFDAEVNE